jgi:hypothetical protein
VDPFQSNRSPGPQSPGQESPASPAAGGGGDPPGSSSPGSGSDGSTRLTEIIAFLLRSGADVVSILTRRKLGIDLGMRAGEANALAGPVARLLERRFQIRGDLNDAADAAEGAGGAVSYVKRIAWSIPLDQVPARSVDAYPAAAPAQPVGTVLLADERPKAPARVPPTPAPVPPASVGAFHDRDGRPMPGSGPAKAFLEGFDEL